MFRGIAGAVMVFTGGTIMLALVASKLRENMNPHQPTNNCFVVSTNGLKYGPVNRMYADGNGMTVVEMKGGATAKVWAQRTEDCQ